MSPRGGSVCATPGCPNLVDHGHCPTHRRQQRQHSDAKRPTASQRGYDVKWRRNRARFLTANPVCIDCGATATIADHAPRSRKELLAAGEEHPDAWQHLQPRCDHCHNTRTAQAQPGGWHTGGGGPPKRA